MVEAGDEQMNFDSLFNQIAALVLCHSPSGVEGEVDQFILNELRALGVDYWQDSAGNIIAKFAGREAGSVAVTAHKDEIGAIVKAIKPSGRLVVRKLGGSFPWIYGEGVMDILGDHQTVSGILSFGSRHVSHESPQKAQQDHAPVRWEEAWIETKLTPDQLDVAGVRPGSRVVVGKHRKQPIRLQDHIASYTLDNKASVAILLALAHRLRDTQPRQDTYLVASAKEEVGAVGALYFSQRQRLDALIALEICPLAREYAIADSTAPILLNQDGYGIYDEGLTQDLADSARQANIPIQQAVIAGFGSDASIAMKFGHVARGACLGFATENTHGYEIAPLGAIAHCITLLAQYLIT